MIYLVEGDDLIMAEKRDTPVIIDDIGRIDFSVADPPSRHRYVKLREGADYGANHDPNHDPKMISTLELTDEDIQKADEEGRPLFEVW